MKTKTLLLRQVVEALLNRSSITRQQILNEFPVRPATLFDAVRYLTQEGFLEEPERRTKRTGRKASPICIRRQYGYFLGIDFDLTQTLGVVIDAQGEVIHSTRQLSGIRKNIKTARAEIQAVIRDLRGKLGAQWKLVKGVGFADPGLVETHAGVSVKAVNVPGWDQLETAKWLQAVAGVSSVIYSNTAVRAYAEYMRGGFPRTTSVFHMHLNTAVGGGLVKNGEVFLGDTCCAMEVGHVVVQDGGPLCQCGNRGCLEAVVGLGGIRRRVEDLNRNGVSTRLDARSFSFEQLAECVRNRDRVARSLVEELCGYIGAGMASIVAILNPGVIIFSGGLSLLGDALIQPVRHILSLRCIPVALEKLEMRVSSLTEEATALGAALTVRRRILLQEADRLTQKD
jgi:glucokinase